MRINNFAPICLFVYNRVDLTKKTIEALQRNIYADKSDLFIFSDSAKNLEDLTMVNEVREYLNTIPQESFKSITITAREKNLGLANSIIQGVSLILSEFDRIIVLEDDLISSHLFLEYMNNYLEIYKDNENVASIHGWSFPIKNNKFETYFLRGADCWGWATWKRAWKYFESNSEILLAKISEKKLKKKFDLNGAYPYFNMLKEHMEGKNNSWAIRWYASAFLNEMYTLYPRCSLIQNIGFENPLSTHTKSKDISNIFTKPIDKNYKLSISKVPIIENLEIKSEIIILLKKNNRLYLKLIRKFKRFFKILLRIIKI